MKKSLAVYISIIILLAACETTDKPDVYQKKNYNVKYIAAPNIILDGQIKETLWRHLPIMDNFVLSWEDNAPGQPTKFRAFYSDDRFYFLFEAHDSTLTVLPVVENEDNLTKEDRVEIYFAHNAELTQPYYCVEIDPQGRILDYKAEYPGKKFDFEIDWGDIQAAASRTDAGYIVEVSISLTAMRNLGYNLNGGEDNPLHVAVFRADFDKDKQGKLIKHWQTWDDPKLEVLDFHHPQTFGNFILEK